VVSKNEPDAGCAITRPRPHPAIGSPLREDPQRRARDEIDADGSPAQVTTTISNKQNGAVAIAHNPITVPDFFDLLSIGSQELICSLEPDFAKLSLCPPTDANANFDFRRIRHLISSTNKPLSKPLKAAVTNGAIQTVTNSMIGLQS
jgi:hypothetical protein